MTLTAKATPTPTLIRGSIEDLCLVANSATLKSPVWRYYIIPNSCLYHSPYLPFALPASRDRNLEFLLVVWSTGIIQLTDRPSMAADLHLLTLPPPAFALDAATYAARPVPSVEEFEQLWAVWDFLTTKLIPKQELLSKPIRLRNCCLFYLGHIPTFLDIHVSRSIQGVPTEPALFRQIFERGIDPDVDNPEKCHQHSEIPDTWPPVEEILAFRDRVRKRVISLYETGTVDANRALGRSLWLSFEHEGMSAGSHPC
jgi:hypothetical protein